MISRLFFFFSRKVCMELDVVCPQVAKYIAGKGVWM